MKLRCIMFGCRYREATAETVDGRCIVKVKCIFCGKEKVLANEPWSEMNKILHIPHGRR